MVLPASIGAALHAALHSLELLSWLTRGPSSSVCPSLHCPECPVVVQHQIPSAVTDALAFAQGAYSACEARGQPGSAGCPNLFWWGFIVGVLSALIVLGVALGAFAVYLRAARRRADAPAEAASASAGADPVGAFIRGASRPWRASSPATPARLKSLRDADA
jgi:hypothetical protein